MFTRIGRFFKAIFNAILGEAEGQMPLSMLEQSVREMLDNLRSAARGHGHHDRLRDQGQA